jgi:hypothetical protein
MGDHQIKVVTLGLQSAAAITFLSEQFEHSLGCQAVVEPAWGANQHDPISIRDHWLPRSKQDLFDITIKRRESRQIAEPMGRSPKLGWPVVFHVLD